MPNCGVCGQRVEVESSGKSEITTCWYRPVDGDEVKQAFRVLAAHGVPKERARTVANGIDVLLTRYSKEMQSLMSEIHALRVENQKLIEGTYKENCK